MKRLNRKHIRVLSLLLAFILLAVSAMATEKPSPPSPFSIQVPIEKSKTEPTAKPETTEKSKPEAKVNEIQQSQPKARMPKETKKDNTPSPDFLQREPPPLPQVFEEDGNTEGLKSYKPQTQIIRDEEFAILEISLKDVSRLVCFTDITKVVYSKEKGIEIKTSGRSAYIKNLPKETMNPVTGRLTIAYDRRPKELYVICGDKTFSLVLIPKDIPAVTAYLQSSFADKAKALTHERSSTYEDTILSLIKSAYFESPPLGYEVSEINKPVKEFREVQIVHSKDYTGIMYQVQEYVLIARVELTVDETTILDVLKPENPLAVSIVSLYLRPGDQTRAFIVRRIK